MHRTAVAAISLTMTNPLVTASYDHVVIIDSQVVLEAKPLEQLPWGSLFQGSVLLLVTRQVQSEIDRKKNDGRLGKRARAFNKLLDGFILHRVPSAIMETPKIDVATVSNRSIDWDALDDLDRDDGDDRIVAQALNAIIDEPTRLVLLSHDMRPRDAAANHGLRAVKLPETWLRDPEPTPDQKRINELEAKVRLLAADQPQLVVRLGIVTPEPWIYREVSAATVEQTQAVLSRELANAPRQSRGGPIGIGLGTYDYSHDDRVEAWEATMREDIPLMHRGLTMLHAQHRIRVTVENVGPISAEGLSLEIRSGNVTLHSMPYWVLVGGPPAPHPRLLHHLPAFNPRNLVELRREPFSFYWDERGPDNHLILSCASFRQEKEYVVEVSVELLSGTPPKAQIEAIVTASNMRGDVKGHLLVDVERRSVQFDDVYDTAEAALKVRPLVDLSKDAESDDYFWFRNNGVEYEPD